jgi:transposase
MALGKREAKQQDLFVTSEALQAAPGHSFYDRLGKLLLSQDFDEFAEEICAPFYAEKGRPSLPPGTYFRLMLLGYFERLCSERQIAWRVADSLTLRQFLGYSLSERTPDHSTISKTRRRLSLDVHQAIFVRVLQILADAKLLRGKTLGIDATDLASNASLRNLRHKVTDETYQSYVKDLMKDDPDEPDDPSDEQAGRFDRKRKKSLSNQEWHNPNNPDAKVTRMKNGSTHFAEKCEHAVDLDTGAIIAVTVQGADRGDTESIWTTLGDAAHNLNQAKAKIREALKDQPDKSGTSHSRDMLCEVVADKGYHSRSICTELSAESRDIRSYIAEPARGRQRWRGDTESRDAVYANRRRIRGGRGRALMRKRGELLERPFAHYLDHGGMRRVWLKGHDNIAKRLLIHTAACNLGLLLRKTIGAGTPRGATNAQIAFFLGNIALRICYWALQASQWSKNVKNAKAGNGSWTSFPLLVHF